LSYTYFANGNVNVETNGRDNGRSVTYTYDALNRVSTASSQATSGSDCWGQGFAYDRYANLTTTNVTQCTAPMLSLSVNTNNQITNTGFTYDADGDLAGDGTYTYSWNAEQHLSSAASVTYTYDGDMRRVEKSSGTLYWYCAVCGQILAESDLSGNLTSEYAFFNKQRIARRDVSSGNIYYIFRDRLGSYRTLTDSNGNVQGESDYYPFGGERVISNAVTDNFRFAGMEWDSEDALSHTLNRQSTPAQGRWQTPDPSRGSVMNPQSLNLYSYVRDNPTNYVDPFGLGLCPPLCAVVEQPDGEGVTCDCSPGGAGGGGGGCPNFVGSAIRPDLMPVCPTGPGSPGGRRIPVDSATNKWAHNLLNGVWAAFAKGKCPQKIAAVMAHQGRSYSASAFQASATSTCFYNADNPAFGNLTESQVTGGEVTGEAGNTTLAEALAKSGGDAVTFSTYPNDLTAVAVGNTFLNTATGWDVLHEALHAYTGWMDGQIIGTFGIPCPNCDVGDTSVISTWLQNGCPP
jgi:RHS repeat-associated protein